MGRSDERRWRCRHRAVADELVRPVDERLHVWSVRMSPVILSPGELAVQQSLIYRRHLDTVVIVRYTQPLGTQEFVNGLSGNRSHKTSLLIQPFRVTLFRDAVADKDKARRTKGD